MTVLSALTGLSSEINKTPEITPLEEHRITTLAGIDESRALVAFIVMMYLFIASYACSWGPSKNHLTKSKFNWLCSSTYLIRGQSAGYIPQSFILKVCLPKYLHAMEGLWWVLVV